MPEFTYFPLLGPNRHSDRRLIEVRLRFSKPELSDASITTLADRVAASLQQSGVLMPDEALSDAPLPNNSMDAYARLLADTTLLLQRKTGHRVGFRAVHPQPDSLRRLVLIEHEHCDVGMTAVKLARELLSGQRTDVREPFMRFAEFARARRLPLETEAIIDAARQRRIPCVQLERLPFTVKPDGETRVRPNGLLRLGHGTHARLLDGSFAIGHDDERLVPLLRSADRRRQWLKALGVAQAAPESEREAGSRVHLLGVGSLDRACVERGNGEMEELEDPPAAALAVSKRLRSELGDVPLNVMFDRRMLESGESALLDFDLAPDLGRLLGRGGEVSDSLREAAGQLLDWLIPDPAQLRVPVTAITGTNGKTTTSLMLSRILQHAGRRPGLVCTLGMFIDGEKVSEGDRGSLLGHAQLLASQDMGSAVLETHHRGIAVRGFAYHQNDVGVCLNVSGDHIAPGGIATMDEMVQIKRAVVERSRHTAVFCADNEHSRGMVEHTPARHVWLVSAERTAEQLLSPEQRRPLSCCVLEREGGRDWITLHHARHSKRLMPVAEIPATFDGLARHNTLNAMHAAAAAFALGVPPRTIREALAGFRTDPGEVPGRLNAYDQLPFRVIVDNAHNPDGVRRMSDFMARFAANGRRVLYLAAAPLRTEQVVREMAQAAAGHFDLYFCGDRTPKPGYKPEHKAPLLRESLIANGVAADQVHLVDRGPVAWSRVFDACRTGDTVLMLLAPNELETMHQLVLDRATGTDAQ